MKLLYEGSAVVRIQQRLNAIDVRRSEIRRASRGSTRSSESPPRNMPFRRLSGTRFESTAAATSIRSPHFPSSQQSERRSHSTYSNSSEREHGEGESSRRNVIQHRYNVQSPPPAIQSSPRVGFEHDDSRLKGCPCRPEGVRPEFLLHSRKERTRSCA